MRPVSLDIETAIGVLETTSTSSVVSVPMVLPLVLGFRFKKKGNRICAGGRVLMNS